MFGCIVCDRASLSHICAKCKTTVLTPSFFRRNVGELPVFSFYKYSEIEKLLLTKHTLSGSFIYKILAELSFKKFSENFEYDKTVSVVAVDDSPTDGYSHTAILANGLKGRLLVPEWGRLRAVNRVKYAGQSLEFRKNNPRDFEFKKTKHKEIVLVDDVITTGTTINEAAQRIKKDGFTPIFAITLADARE